MSKRNIRLCLKPGADTMLLAVRGEETPDGFWGQLRSEWGFAGNPGSAVEVPLAAFRGNLDWLKPTCKLHQVGIEWDDDVIAIVRQAQAERSQVDRVLAGRPALDAAAVSARLRGGRFTRNLREFQIRDAGSLIALPNGANFSVPGAGKTTVAYAVYEAERLAGRVERMLVVAPLSAFDAWQTEVDLCFHRHERPAVDVFVDHVPAAAEVLLVNYHRVAAGPYFDDIEAWIRKRPTLVLLDEAHRIKAGQSGTHGSACLDLAYSAARRDILSGTPAPQSPADFVALFDFLWPGQARRILPPDVLSPRPEPGMMHRLAEAIRPLFVRTRKQELGLLQPTISVAQVELDGLHHEIYRALRDRYAGQLRVSMADRSELGRMGTIVMYLLEAATNPQLLAAGSDDDDAVEFRHPPLPVEPGSRLWDLIRRYNQYETPNKFKALAQIIQANAERGRKTLVWSNFVRNLLILERMLARHRPALIYGAIRSLETSLSAARTRQGELRRFRDDSDCMVLLANPAAMSEGVSLHMVCNDAIYLERTFNAGQYLQSLDRIHRLGLSTDTETRITLLTTVGTVDEVVNDRIAAKSETLGEALNDPDLRTMALPDDENFGSVLTDTADLEALFSHLRGEA